MVKNPQVDFKKILDEAERKKIRMKEEKDMQIKAENAQGKVGEEENAEQNEQKIDEQPAEEDDDKKMPST